MNKTLTENEDVKAAQDKGVGLKHLVMPPLYSYWVHTKYKISLCVRKIETNKLVLKSDREGFTWYGTLENFHLFWEA